MGWNIAVSNPDAARQQTVGQAWTLGADFLSGVDTDARFDPGMTGSPLLGPTGQGLDVGVGAGGEVFVRGNAGQLGIDFTRAPAPPQTVGAAPRLRLPRTPMGWLIVGGLAYLVLKK